MSLQTILHDIQSIGFLTDIRQSTIEYPVIMTTHLACIAIFGGMILMTDMRLLGLALTDYSVTEVVKGLRKWKHIGGTLMILMGLLLGASEADKYYPNPFFWTKLTLLGLIAVHAIIFRPLVYSKTEEIDKSGTIPAVAKIAAVSSLVLWFGVLTFGRLIGYWEPPR